MFRVAAHIYPGVFLFVAASVFGFWFARKVAPETATASEFALVYLTIFVWISSLSFLLGYFLRQVLRPSQHRSESVRSARRQAILLGLFAVTILWLQVSGILSAQIALLSFGIFVLLELYAQ